MEDKYLVVNCGSSSLKFSLYEMPSEVVIAKGYIEKIGVDDSFWTINYNGEKITGEKWLDNHKDAVNIMIKELIGNNIVRKMEEIKGVGHRVLHGGEIYSDSVLINDKVLKDIVDMTNLGPLHHPGEIDGIKAMMECLPKAKQVAVFDTAFHQTMPKESYIYAVPYEWYTKYITNKMQGLFNKSDVNLIICHVGSGASITCIKDGKSFDTSMGLTPLDGLVMGTRSGRIDPSIIKFMSDETGMTLEQITNELNKNSGLKGICGKNDFRDMMALIKEGNEQAKLAYEIFMDSIIKHIAEYYFELNGKVDAIVFTAGILENNTLIRENIINKLSGPINTYINKIANDNIGYGHELKEGIITTEESKVPVYVIPTDEEVMIVRDCYRLVKETL